MGQSSSPCLSSGSQFRRGGQLSRIAIPQVSVYLSGNESVCCLILRKRNVLYIHQGFWWLTLDKRSVLRFWPRHLSTTPTKHSPQTPAVPTGREECFPWGHQCLVPAWRIAQPGPLRGQLTMPSAGGLLVAFGCRFFAIAPVPVCCAFGVPSTQLGLPEPLVPRSRPT